MARIPLCQHHHSFFRELLCCWPGNCDCDGCHKVRFRGPKTPVVNLLLFGTAQVGKSTFVKNLLYTYGRYNDDFTLCDEAFNFETRMHEKHLIYQNVFGIVLTLIEHVDEFRLTYENPRNSEYVREIKDYIKSHQSSQIECARMPFGLELTMQYKQMFISLWEDHAIQIAYSRRHEYQLSDSAAYYLSQLERISQPDYDPSIDDILRSRYPTQAFNDYRFKIDGVHFLIRDMGGDMRQRTVNYVHNWLSRQQDANEALGVIYMAALSDYNQQHPFHRNRTCLDESVALFNVLLEWSDLSHAGFLVFLNKADVFEEKLSQFNDFSRYFPNHEGLSSEQAQHLVIDRFEHAHTHSPRSTDPIFLKATCATDLQAMPAIFTAARFFIMSKIVNDRCGHGFLS